MNTATIKFKLLHEGAQRPLPAMDGDACFDLYADSQHMLRKNATVAVSTGIGIELPKGFVGLVCSRSGMALQSGVFVLNAPGIIDPTYRGEIKVILKNLGTYLHTVHKHDRIAQLLIIQKPSVSVQMVDCLSSTERGERGFGSTGA